MNSFRLFVDSDVVISSLLSRSGAAYFLLNTKDLKFFISNISHKELEIVIERLRIGKSEFTKLIREKFTVINLKDTLDKIKSEYGKYVTDINDAHIVAGANVTTARFLISYNLGHFKIDKIKQDLDIIIMTPANFLQYLRSQ